MQAMTKSEMMAFVTQVVTALQTDYPSTKESTAALTQVLENADIIAWKLTHKHIVKRGSRSVLETIVAHNPLNRMKDKKAQ